MIAEKTDIISFLEMAKTSPVLDVRSPSEYSHAHILNAFNLPLFTDEERKVVGTIYKQQSREEAIKIGLDFFAPKMKNMILFAEEVCTQYYSNSKGRILVHCWRGGMRSEAVAWLLSLYGFKVYLLIGGYKKFRNYVLELLNEHLHLKILAGYSGSGKTKVLNELKLRGENIIDLEALAKHKGSAFGYFQKIQPTQEMFENLLAMEIKKYLHQNIWVEDESQRIGNVNIPQSFWQNMRKSSIYFLNIPFEERLKNIYEEYEFLSKAKIELGINRIKKRLGGLETQEALTALEENNLMRCFEILLKYYDRQYKKSLCKRHDWEKLINVIDSNTTNATVNVQKIINALSLQNFA